MKILKPMPLGLSKDKDVGTTKYVLELCLVAIAYVASARIGQIFAIQPGNITPVWVPSGLLLAWALIRGNYIWPGIFIGAFIGNVWAYVSFSSFLIFISSVFAGFMNGLGDSICVVGSAYLIKRMTDKGNPFNNFKSFLALFLFGVLLGPLVSAIMGVSSLLAVGFISSQSYLISLFTWFVGDSVGVLLFAPLILINYFHHQEHHYKNNNLELAVFIVVFASTPFIGIYPETLNILKLQPVLIIIPLFLWCIIRMSRTVCFNAAAYLGIGTILANYLGVGFIAAGSEFQAMLSTQFFIIVTISSVFILSALVTEKDNAIERLNEISNHDALTKIYNRQYFDRRLLEEINRLARYESSFCLLMYDIDFFKKVNDTYGHIFGDNILIQLSEIAASEIRDIDILARWGGEEFIILMPQTKIDGATIVAERIRVCVEKTQLLPEGDLTISIGLVEVNSGDKPENIINRLDVALYDAKNSGRNQVKCAPILGK